MIEIKFSGSAEEVKNEIMNFVGSFGTVGVGATKEEKIVEAGTSAQTEVPPIQNWSTNDCKDVPQETGGVIPTIPTVATEYTVADLQRLAAELVRSKKASKEVLQELLAKYGVKALTELEEANFGAIVEDFKALGADV